MFKHSPTNHAWNLSFDPAIEMGARIGEIEAMCAPPHEAARQPDAVASLAFRQGWERMAGQVCDQCRSRAAQPSARPAFRP